MKRSILAILTAVFMLVQLDANSQYPTDYTFESYKIKEGLSEGGTYSIFQDHLGYIWVGTIGLERFDGYTFKNYRSSVFDSAAIPSGQKRVIKEDAQNNLWVCTELSISKLNRSTDTWENFENKNISDRLADISFEKGTNLIYVATYKDGLWSLNPKTKTWTKYPYTINALRKIVEISDNELLISTTNGLVVFNKKTKTFGTTYLQSENPASAIKFNIFTEKDPTHWYVSSTNGIYLFSKKEGLVPAFQNAKGNDNTIMDSLVTAIHFDKTKQELWAKIAKKGLDIIHLKTNTITHLNNENYPDPNFIKNSISQIIQDIQGNIWLSTYDGVFKYNPTRKEIKTISRAI